MWARLKPSTSTRSQGANRATCSSSDAGASEPALFLAFLVVWGGYWLALARPGRTVRVAALVVKPRLLGTGD